MLPAPRRTRLGVVAMALGLAAPAWASDGLTVERIVMVMRHGVRPPTKEPALPPEIAPDPWPSWPVPPGWLTPHGAEAVRLLGKADRASFAADGLLQMSGCPAEGDVAVSSDSDERTIATGDAWLAGFAPGCPIANRHLAQDTPDPLFHDPNIATLDPAEADRAVADALGPSGIAGLEREAKPALTALDRILCGDRTGECGVPATTTLIPARVGKLPKMTGALEIGSSGAQSILLEYADGKPMSDVGWGRATPRDIALIGTLHSESFVVHARPPLLAAANAAGISRAIAAALNGRSAAKITLIVGHDTNVANLAGLLGLHWRIAGFAADDPAPGGALIFELLRGSSADRFVRVSYRSQNLEQIRVLSPEKPERQSIDVTRCGENGVCALHRFTELISR